MVVLLLLWKLKDCRGRKTENLHQTGEKHHQRARIQGPIWALVKYDISFENTHTQSQMYDDKGAGNV